MTKQNQKEEKVEASQILHHSESSTSTLGNKTKYLSRPLPVIETGTKVKTSVIAKPATENHNSFKTNEQSTVGNKVKESETRKPATENPSSLQSIKQSSVSEELAGNRVKNI